MEHKHTNHLIHESSPYLLQHAHNPVEWYPWGKESFNKAQKENKLIIVSIGYAACHWCHVMEHESFEDEKVAELMNSRFVSVKVDREERPDIDQVYMNIVQNLTGSGGWPLNCIVLSDGKPLYGGTYFSKSQWIEMLEKISDWAKENPELSEKQANKLTQEILSIEMGNSNSENEVFSINDLHSIFNVWKSEIDFINGGSMKAPKFPLPVGYQYLLHYYYLTKNQNALNAVIITLNKMANGGIYDQTGGGFSRYSTDKYWKVPHFEKMLYDNAQLVSLYAAAYQYTKNSFYKTIVTETLNFVQRELTSEDGGFFSSIDADNEGEEGKYYVWTKKELQKASGIYSELLFEYYNITEKGNWENGKNILFKSASDNDFAARNNITENELSIQIHEAKNILLKERNKRIRPDTDDKILISWNMLMLKAYIDAYRIFDSIHYLDIAIKNAEFFQTKIKTNDYRINRNYKAGKYAINGFLDDYAFTVTAFISLFQATFDEKWLLEAAQLMTYAINHFYNQQIGLFYYTSDIDPPLIARNIELTDNVIPSANSEMAKNLFLMGHYFYNDDYIEKSRRMLHNVYENALQSGTYYANWDILMTWFINEPYEVSIVGNEADILRKEFEKHYLPNVFLSGCKNQGTLPSLEYKLIEGQTTIYICRNRVCKQPVTEVKDALKIISDGY